MKQQAFAVLVDFRVLVIKPWIKTRATKNKTIRSCDVSQNSSNEVREANVTHSSTLYYLNAFVFVHQLVKHILSETKMCKLPIKTACSKR